MTLPFEMKFLQADCLLDLMRLQNVIASNLSSPEIFMLHDDRYFREVLRHEYSIIGMINDKELIAYSIIRFPGVSEDNLGRDINLREEELAKVAHLQAVAVHPDYRGNGLQRKLTCAHLCVIEEMGYEHVCCTVSPKNPVSLRNILSFGLLIEGLCPKICNWWRYILHKNITQSNLIDMGVRRKEIRINISDIEGQLNLLKKGFKGFKIANLPEGSEVFFAKF